MDKQEILDAVFNELNCDDARSGDDGEEEVSCCDVQPVLRQNTSSDGGGISPDKGR